MRTGVDYYPEHWPRERWDTDAQLMKDAGLTIVRLAEFAWSRIEREPGRIDFAWLDDALGILNSNGILVVMGTPTATPPRWLADDAEARGESIYQVDRLGRRRAFGTRRHYCHNSPFYQAESRRIVETQARHYAGHGGIIGWQIDNEFGCHDTTVCYCDDCRAAFAKWLESRYGSIGAVNDAWGTAFWSQEYRSFNEVIVPAFTAVEQPGRHTHNPGLLLDYQRFSSDSIVRYQKLQIDLIRAHSSAPITHNFMGHFADIDLYDLASDLDFISWDNYPANQWGHSTAGSTAMAHDITRGTKRSNFWVMEQLSGPCGWAVLGPTPAPGQIRLWSYQGIAHGADAIVYFRWRAARFGTEQYWYGILDHDGQPRRRYDEISGVGTELAKLSDELDGTSYPADVLLYRSFDNLWSQRFQPHADGLSYEAELQEWHNALSAFGAQIDVGMLPSDRTPYRLVVAPLLNLTTPDMEQRISDYVHRGGTLVLTFRSGTREWTNAMRDSAIPGPFAEMAGITVEDFDALSAARTVGVKGSGIAGTARLWVDVVEPASSDVEVVATYGEGYYAGRAAITSRRLGNGTVVYVGCDLDAATLRDLAASIAREAGVFSARKRLVGEAPDTVELVLRSGGRYDGRAVLFLLNHDARPATVTLHHEARDLLTNGDVTSVTLDPWGVGILGVTL